MRLTIARAGVHHRRMLNSPFLRALVLVCAVFATSVAPGGWLVCLGADGHFALEAAAGACADGQSAAESGSGARSIGDRGGCLDAELGGAAVVRAQPRLGTGVGIGLIVLPRVTSATGIDCAVLPCSLPAQAAHPSIFGRHLQSTILRC